MIVIYHTVNNMIKTIRYNSWNDFKRDFTKDLFSDGIYKKDCYIFRGQGEETWNLVSYFQREYGKRIEWDMKKVIEEQLLKSFKEKCQRYSDEDIVNNLDEDELRILAQHYHVPTTLLDWSYSPYIAAFFAFSQCFRTNESQNVAIWALQRNHQIWNDSSGATIIDKLVTVNKRQRWQQGCFTKIEHSESSLDGYAENREKGDSRINLNEAIIKFTIPKAERLQALAELEAMNITYPVILGGIESCGNAAILDVQMKYFKE